jgi:thioredoxin-like negative regulator of GroEL
MALRIHDPLPSLEGAVGWLNAPSPPEVDFPGQPVFVYFWSMSCYVCHEVAPQIAGWYERYAPRGLRFLAVHQPRNAQELDIERVAQDAQVAMRATYAVAVDNELRIVGRFGNQFVPAYYLFDAEHRLRHFQAGDKGYARIEAAIERVLEEAAQTARA